MNEQDEILISRLLEGRLSQSEMTAVNERIADDPDFRVELLRAGRQDATLREILQVRDRKPILSAAVGDKGGKPNHFRRRYLWITAAAVFLCAASAWLWLGRETDPEPIAQILAGADTRAWLQRADTRLALNASMPLFADDRIDTGEVPAGLVPAAVTVSYPDGTRVNLDAGVQALFGASTDGKVVEVAVGAVRAEVAPQPAGRPMRFLSRFGRATVVGTRLAFLVDSAGARLEVTEGKVELHRAVDDFKATVSAGQYAVVTASADVELVAQPLSTSETAAETFIENFENVAVGMTPDCAAGPEKLRWRVAAADGNRFAEVESTELAELEIGRKYISNYRLECRFRVDNATTSIGLYTPFYGVDESTWGMEVRGEEVYLLAGKTNPTVVGTDGRTPATQLKPPAAGEWRRLRLTVDAHTMSFEIDGQPVVVNQPNFMHPGVWRFFAKGGRVQIDDLKVETIPH